MIKFTKDIIAKIASLQKIEQNLRKSINQNISSDTLTKHFDTAIKLFNEIDESLLQNQSNIPDTEFFCYLKQARNALHYIKESVERRRNFKKSKMPTEATAPSFDVKLAASILLPYDGDDEKLPAFIDAVKLLKTMAPNDEQTLKLFLMTRIGGKARNALPTDVTNKTINDIVKLIKDACECKTTTEQVMAKIKSVKKGLPKQQYCNEIETLCNKLANAYMKDNVPHETAKKLAAKAGLETLIKLTPNETAKMALQIGSYSTIEQAIQKLNELPENENQNQMNNVFHFNHRRSTPNRGNWRRGSNNNNFTPRYNQNNQRFNDREYSNFNARQYGNNRGARGGYRQPHQGHTRQVGRIYFANQQILPEEQNVTANLPQGWQNIQNCNQLNPNMPITAQQARMQPSNQPFLGTIGQYTQ